MLGLEVIYHNVFRGLEAVREDSISFNEKDFGNIFQRKRRLEQRLCGFQNCLDRNPSDASASFERKLQKEYNDVLRQEELLRYQKSRGNWVKHGDRN
jgi:hypothetical protein